MLKPIDLPAQSEAVVPTLQDVDVVFSAGCYAGYEVESEADAAAKMIALAEVIGYRDAWLVRSQIDGRLRLWVKMGDE